MLKRIYKIISHDMYVMNILVCGPYGNFQDKICLDVGLRNFSFFLFVKHRSGSYMFEIKLIFIMSIIITFHLRMNINYDCVFILLKLK